MDWTLAWGPVALVRHWLAPPPDGVSLVPLPPAGLLSFAQSSEGNAEREAEELLSERDLGQI